MNIWSAREKSIDWLSKKTKVEGEILNEGFDYLADLVSLFEKRGHSEGDSEIGQFCRISSITLAKSSHLLLGCYSLILDGLAQESGALLRPLIETYELLIYLCKDKSRINQVIEGKLPSAGAIGKEISGDYQNLRTYLNDNASHFSYKTNSVLDLFDENIKVNAIPNHSIEVFRTNIHLLNAFQVCILFEAVNCLYAIDFDANVLADKIDKWHKACRKTFPPPK